MDTDRILDRIQSLGLDQFKSQERLRTFGEFTEAFLACPYLYLRTAPQYLLDMFDHYGQRPVSRIGQDSPRFRVFDSEVSGATLVGQERVQNAFYSFLSGFARKSRADKMVLFHGPNGSGKTSFVECLVGALERYCQSPEGTLLRFNWIFSENDERMSIGFDASEGESVVDTLALINERDISARVPCEMNDSPLFLIPREVRREIIEKALEGYDGPCRPDHNYSFFLEGDLCPKCRKIYDALLAVNQGDWKAVVKHVQVERYYISKRYRVGAVTIEPQGNIDASTRPVLNERNWNLPWVMRTLNLYEPVGDIIDANNGILEYGDFLKRNPEANKYLLTTCERGTVSLPHFMAYLNLLIIGTTNENQLSMFKRSPDFSSFKGRMELIPFPYLLMISKELELYANHLELFSRDRHITPHTAEIAATWAVLTRLKKPEPKNYRGQVSALVSRLTPLEKARFYDTAEPPSRLKESERRLLRAALVEIRREHEDAEAEFEGLWGPEYEGRRGASPREIMTALGLAAENRRYHCLTPMAVFETLAEIGKDASLYDFLRLEPDRGYHDHENFLEEVKKEYIRIASEEVYISIGLVEETEYDRVFLEYFKNVKASESGERIFNPATKDYEDPNQELMERVEKLVEIQDTTREHRSNVMTRIAAWSLDNPQKEIDYHRLFPGILDALRQNFFQERRRRLQLIENDILKHGSEDFEALAPAERQHVEEVLTRMENEYGYCQHCAKDVIGFVLSHSS